MKKILMLGGLRYLIPVIEAAHQLGCHVITCDYLPDNIAHKYSDEYHNVSITDREAVLRLARDLQIDGIMSFAVDPGVLTAAYVAEELGLPAPGPYQSVEILQNKDKFRAFLAANHFNVPQSGGFTSVDEARAGIAAFHWPLIVKPTDSAGSKGVRRIDTPDQLAAAFDYAMQNSISGRVIIEEFIEQQGYSSGSECFSINSRLVFSSFSDQRFDEHAANPYTPAASSWPSTTPESYRAYLNNELQRLFTLLEMRTSIYNVETRIGKNGKPYIMEVSPRGGGNRIAELLKIATGIDLIESSVRAAIGLPVEGINMPSFQGIHTYKMIYADRQGIYQGIQLGDMARKHLIEQDVWTKSGDPVRPFTGANEAIGIFFFRFADEAELERTFPLIQQEIKVVVK